MLLVCGAVVTRFSPIALRDSFASVLPDCCSHTERAFLSGTECFSLIWPQERVTGKWHYPGCLCRVVRWMLVLWQWQRGVVVHWAPWVSALLLSPGLNVSWISAASVDLLFTSYVRVPGCSVCPEMLVVRGEVSGKALKITLIPLKYNAMSVY